MKAKPPAIAKDIDNAVAVWQSLIDNPGKNSEVLLKEPAEATPSSWHIWLPPHFNTALDLRYLQKQKTKNKEVEIGRAHV